MVILKAKLQEKSALIFENVLFLELIIKLFAFSVKCKQNNKI